MLEKKLKKYIDISIAMAFLQFVLIFFIPFVSVEGTALQRAMAYIIASLFWMSIILEIVLACESNRERKRLERRWPRLKKFKYSLVGVVSFFKNKEAIITDVVLFVSVGLLGTIIWIDVKTSWIIISVVSVFILSFSLHCILNGRNYRCLKEIKCTIKERKENE